MLAGSNVMAELHSAALRPLTLYFTSGSGSGNGMPSDEFTNVCATCKWLFESTWKHYLSRVGKATTSFIV